MDIENISLKKIISYYYDQENSALNSEDYNIEGNEKTIYKVTDHLISKSNLELAASLTFEMFNLEESKKNNFNIEKLKLKNGEEVEFICVSQDSFKDDFDWPEEIQELKKTLNAIIKSSFLTLNLLKKILLNLNKDNWESDPGKNFDSNKDLILNIYYSSKEQTKYLNANFEQLFNDKQSSYMVFTYPIDLNPESVEVYCCHIDQNIKFSENQRNTICNYLEKRNNTPIFVLQCKY